MPRPALREQVHPPTSEGPGRLERYQQAKNYWEKASQSKPPEPKQASQSKSPELNQDITKRRIELLEQIRHKLGSTPCVCVTGAVAFREGDAELKVLVGQIAAKLAESLQDRVWFVTCGMPGVQKVFAEHCGDGSRLWNLVPDGLGSGCGIGGEVSVSSIDDRRAVFGLLGDVYIVVEGGTGVALQAKASASRGAYIIPVMRSRGFPIEAFVRPDFIGEEQWALLKSGGASSAETLDAVVACASNFVAQRGTTERSSSTAETETNSSHSEAFPTDDNDLDVVLCPPPVASSHPVLQLQLQPSLPLLPPPVADQKQQQQRQPEQCVPAAKPPKFQCVPPVDPRHAEFLERFATVAAKAEAFLQDSPLQDLSCDGSSAARAPACTWQRSCDDAFRAEFIERVAALAAQVELLQTDPMKTADF